MRGAGAVSSTRPTAAFFIVENTMGARPAASAAAIVCTTVAAASAVSTKGIVWRSNRKPGKFANRALPSVSEVMPVLSETKNTARFVRVWSLRAEGMPRG